MTTTAVIPQLMELNDEQAEAWAAAMIAEAEALFRHDLDRLPKVNDPALLERAEALHGALAEWVDAAEALYDQLRALEQSGRSIANLKELHRHIGLARVRLPYTPAESVELGERKRRGEIKYEIVNIEEERRALQARAAS